MKNYIVITLMGLFFTGLVLSSCKKSVDGSIQDASTRRSFTPTNLSVKVSTDTASFSWTAPLFSINNMTYSVDIATDSLFSDIVYTVKSDTTSAYATDSVLLLNTPYYYRVRVNAYTILAPSNYLVATNGLHLPSTFKLLGLQYLKVIRESEITTTSVLLHWYLNKDTKEVTHVVLTPSDGSSPINVPVVGDEITHGQKNITGLEAGKKYTLQLFAGKRSMGFTTVSTPKVATITTTITAGVDSLSAAIATAADGDIIGLNPGTYTLTSITPILQKTITLRSVSNNPSDTRILSREFDLVGDGAGITLIGVDVSGNYTGSSFGTTFLQLYGSQAATNVPATFTNVKIDNCIIHDYTRCVIRGNYGTNANDFKIGNVTINNSQVYHVDQVSATGYYQFVLDKVQFNALSFTRSTFYGLGNGMISMSTQLAAPTTIPSINIDYCTFNNIGGSTKYLLLDAKANLVNYNLSNSILANTPISGSLNNAAFRSTGAGNILTFAHNNYFKFSASVGGFDLVLTELLQSNNYTSDLGWVPSTTNFSLSTLPSTSSVLTASSNNGTIGDPRWAY